MDNYLCCVLMVDGQLSAYRFILCDYYTGMEK